MAFVPLPNALLLIQISLLLSCFFNTVYGDAISPAEDPHDHHHHHHHHHPVQPPTKPPVHEPVKPPTKPPVHSSVKSPAKPPVHPPVKSPAKPPVHSPPVKPPVKPPVHSPVKSPAKPPVHPHPPVMPPRRPLPVKKLLAVEGVVLCKSCKYKGVHTLVKDAPLAKAVVKLECNNTKRGMVELTETDKNGNFLFKPPKVTAMAFRKCKVFLVSSPVANCNVSTNFHDGIAGATLIPDHKMPVKTSMYQFFNVGPLAFESSKKCHY